MTQDADWSPTDPSDLTGRSIERAELDEASGALRCRLDTGRDLRVIPSPQEAPDDPPNWELFMPDGWLLEYGPERRSRIVRSDRPEAG